MPLSVTQARPQKLGGTTSATPGAISSVGVARPSGGVSVSNNYGLQGYGGAGNSVQPLTIGGGLRQVQKSAAGTIDSVDTALQEYQRLAQQIAASQRPVMPQRIDVAAINAQARKQAEKSVKPLYTKKLNDMLARFAVRRQRAQQDFDTSVEDIDTNLSEIKESNELERGRTAEDVAANLGELGTAEDRFQTASGQQFEDARLAEAGQLADAGLTTSGIGRQQANRSITNRNLTEKEQTEEFESQRTAQVVLKARTFEDLAKSDAFSTSRAEKGKKATKLDLDRLLEDIGSEESSDKFTLEQQRLSDISGRVSDYSQVQFNKILAGIRDPRVLEATARTYGGIF